MAATGEEVTVTAVVSGRVQGVGYRQFVFGRAHALALRGWVRNRDDGTVEVVALGTRPAVEQLLSLLRQGPRFADVSDVHATWGVRDDVPHDFAIR